MRSGRGLVGGSLLLALAAAALGAPAAQPAGAPGLVAAYGFEETTGASAVDSSGSGNTGTISGASSTTAGKFGRALSFDGANDIVSIADSSSLDLAAAMTLEAWVSPQGGGWRTVLLKERPSGLAYALYSSTDSGVPSAEVRTSGSAETRGPAALPASSWSHLATTYDGTTLRLYVNGTQVSSRALTGAIEVGTGAVRIGGNTVWGEYFGGLIDEVRVYNRELTAGEIQADMAAPIAASDAQAPTAPASLTAAVTQDDVQLAWSASTDDVGVTGYRVHRSATAGFTPSAATGIGSPTGTSFEDEDRPAGTWYYRVLAVDAAGNTSAASDQASATVQPDTTPPTISFNHACDGSDRISDFGSTSLAFADDRGRTSVHVEIEGQTIYAPTPPLPNATSLTFHWWAFPTFTPGPHELTAIARDTAGNETTATCTWLVDYPLFQIDFTAPTNGTTLSGTTTLTTETQADGLPISWPTPVYYVDGVALGRSFSTSPGHPLVWDSRTVVDGAHTLKATFDWNGPVAATTTIQVTVDNAPPPLPTGLVAAYGFEEASGAAVVDASGRGNAGTIAGAVRNTSGKYGSALSFDGVNDLVTIADSASLDLTTGMTLEAWVYPTAVNGWRTVLMKERPGGMAYTLYSGTNNARPGVFVDTTTELDARGTATLALNTWTHVAGTYDGSMLRFYVNGALVASRAVTGSLRVSTGALKLGGNNVWGEWFAGRIDEVRVYNRALSVAEIAADRDNPIATP